MLKLAEIMQKEERFGRRLWSAYSASVLPEQLLSEGKPLVAGRFVPQAPWLLTVCLWHPSASPSTYSAGVLAHQTYVLQCVVSDGIVVGCVKRLGLAP